MTVVPHTEPYPWPYDEALDGQTIALVLAGWDTEWHGRALADAGPTCLDLVAAVAGAGGLVVSVAHRGAPPLDTGGVGVAVEAAGLDAFHDGPLDSLLRRAGRTHLVVAGHGLEGPVHSTLRSANDRGYECLLVADASSPLTTDCVEAASSTVCMSGGIFGAVGSAVDVIAALVPGGTL